MITKKPVNIALFNMDNLRSSQIILTHKADVTNRLYTIIIHARTKKR